MSLANLSWCSWLLPLYSWARESREVTYTFGTSGVGMLLARLNCSPDRESVRSLGGQEDGGRRTVGLHHGDGVGLVEDDADLLLVALDAVEHLAQGSEDCSARAARSAGQETWVISRDTPILFTSKKMTMRAARRANQPMAPG